MKLSKKPIIFITHFIAVALVFRSFIDFVMIYLNGYEAHVYINLYGEAHIELIALSVLNVFLVFGLVWHIRQIRHKPPFPPTI